MSQYLVLERLEVQNANCIAGFTWGFPAITHFLGFSHKLHRQLRDEYPIEMDGCAVICHEYEIHAYQSAPFRDFEFIQSKKPPYLAGHDKRANPPIIEEGKMNMIVSLVIPFSREFVGNDESKRVFENKVTELCRKGRLAGGTILSVKSVVVRGASSKKDILKMNKSLKRILMPGFALMDRSNALAEHFNRLKEDDESVELIEAWLDFSALKYRAIPSVNTQKDFIDEKADAIWELLPKPVSKGWLVPIMSGYKAISELYQPGEVENVRDSEVPARFVEAVHSIGEWLAVFRLNHLDEAIWRYQVEDDWYLCKQSVADLPEATAEETQQFNFEDVLANI